jgi:hypothetical protein
VRLIQLPRATFKKARNWLTSKMEAQAKKQTPVPANSPDQKEVPRIAY